MKRKLTALLSALIISCTALCEPIQDTIGISVVAEAASVVETPTVNKKSGTYTVSDGLTLTLSCDTKGAKIYYSTDGGKKYKTYSKAFKLTKNATVKFYAKKNGVKSKILSRTYKLTPKFTVSPEAGSYTSSKTVKISTDLEGVKFYYTLDGSKPDKKSTAYTSKGITIKKTAKLRILAVKNGWTNGYATKSYTIGKSGKSDSENTSSESTVSVKSILNDYEKKYAYSTLTSKQKKLYGLMYEGIAKHSNKINVSSIKASISDLEPAFRALEGDNPQFFWIDGSLDYMYFGTTLQEVMPGYSRTKSEAEKIQKKLDKEVNKIIKKAMKYDSLFERVLYLHDYVVDNTTYTVSGNAYIREVDGPLLNGAAICEGYSKALSYLCQSIGIENVCIMGYANTLHMWNVVKLDGKWYHIDATFDDPVGTKPVLSHDYFCITEKEMLKDHSIDNFFPVPKATSTKYNYYKVKGIKVHTKTSEAFSALIGAAAKNYKKKVYRTEIVCDYSIVDSTLAKIKTSLFSELGKYGYYPSEVFYGQIGRTVYIELKP